MAYKPRVLAVADGGSGASTLTGVLIGNGTSAFTAQSNTGNTVLIQSQTVSGVSEITFTSGIGSTYNDYFLVIDGLSTSVNADSIDLTVSTNGGSSYLTTGYAGQYFAAFGGSSGANPITTGIRLFYVPDQNTLGYGTLRIYSLFNGSNPNFTGHTTGVNAGICLTTLIGGFTGNTVVNALRIKATTGNLTGTVKLFGIVN